MSVDLERLDAAIAYIEAHPLEWNQHWWFTRTACGTACCLAGTVAMLDGWTPANWTRGFAADTQEAWEVEKNGAPRYVREVAAELLGVSRLAAYVLFAGDNDLDRIKKIRAELAGEVSGE
jgi:hypothetical protein